MILWFQQAKLFHLGLNSLTLQLILKLLFAKNLRGWLKRWLIKENTNRARVISYMPDY